MHCFPNASIFYGESDLEIEIFGRDAIIIKAIPVTLSQIKISEMISDIIDQLNEQNQMPSLEEKKEKILASLACRAAIKAHNILSGEEVEALCTSIGRNTF